MHGAREGWKRDRGEERAGEREREREREGGPPNGLWCPWVSTARLVLPLVPWLESAVHTHGEDDPTPALGLELLQSRAG